MIASAEEYIPENPPQGRFVLHSWRICCYLWETEGASTGAAPLLEVEEVRYGAGQMGHQLHSDPPVRFHGVVSRVRTLGHDGISDVTQNRGHILLPAVAVRAHQSHVLLEVGFPIILSHVQGCLIPQLIGRAGHNLTGQDAGGHNEVSWFDYGYFNSPGLHLIAKAIRKSFHAVFRYTVRRPQGISHPPIHAGQVHNTACRHRNIRLLYSSSTL